MDAEGLKKLSVDYEALGFFITERPESQGLVFVVENISSELSVKSGEKIRQNSGRNQYRRSNERTERSPNTLARLEAKREAKKAQDEKRVADLACCRLELQRSKETEILTRRENIELATKIESMQKHFNELSVQHEALTKEFEDLLEEVIQCHSEEEKNSVTNELILICNNVLARENNCES